MRNFSILAVSCFALIFLNITASLAEDTFSAHVVFTNMKNNCHKKYEKFMKGDTDNMIGGSYAYNECLQAQIEKITKKLFYPEHEKKFFENLSGAATNYYSLTNEIYFNNKKCDAHCGTMFIPLKIQAVSPIYENTLWQLLFISSEHNIGLPDSEPPVIERDKELRN